MNMTVHNGAQRPSSFYDIHGCMVLDNNGKLLPLVGRCWVLRAVQCGMLAEYPIISHWITVPSVWSYFVILLLATSHSLYSLRQKRNKKPCGMTTKGTLHPSCSRWLWKKTQSYFQTLCQIWGLWTHVTRSRCTPTLVVSALTIAPWFTAGCVHYVRRIQYTEWRNFRIYLK